MWDGIIHDTTIFHLGVVVLQDKNIISTRENFGRIGVGLGRQTGILPGNPTPNPT